MKGNKSKFVIAAIVLALIGIVYTITHNSLDSLLAIPYILIGIVGGFFAKFFYRDTDKKIKVAKEKHEEAKKQTDIAMECVQEKIKDIEETRIIIDEEMKKDVEEVEKKMEAMDAGELVDWGNEFLRNARDGRSEIDK